MRHAPFVSPLLDRIGDESDDCLPRDAAAAARMTAKSALITGTTLALHLLAGTATATACACCSDTASRYVEVERLAGWRMAEIERMSFAGSAKLATGEAGAKIKGVETPATDYRLAVSRTKDRMVFSLRDQTGRAGSLALAIPKTISIFEVDPRGDAQDEGLGPSLYKEWKLTADARGDGLFRGVVGKGQKLTLVLHGRGRGCWTLLVHGRTKLTLHGALER